MPEWVQRALREFQCHPVSACVCVCVLVDSFLGRASSLEIPTLVQGHFMISCLLSGCPRVGAGNPTYSPLPGNFPSHLQSSLPCSHIPKHVYFSYVSAKASE